MKTTPRTPSEFERELTALLNKHSQENGSNTPDFILAAYLVDCLELFNNTSRWRESWYGKSLSVGGVKEIIEDISAPPGEGPIPTPQEDPPKNLICWSCSGPLIIRHHPGHLYSAFCDGCRHIPESDLFEKIEQAATHFNSMLP